METVLEKDKALMEKQNKWEVNNFIPISLLPRFHADSYALLSFPVATICCPEKNRERRHKYY